MALPPDALDLAARQYGVLSRRQLLRWLPPSSLEGKVRRRAFEPLERGVYRVTDGVAVAGQSAVAAALRCGPGAVLTGPFVLGHHRIEGFDLDAPFEVLVPSRRRLANLAFTTRRDPDPGRPVELLGEVRLASKVDALVDSARHLGRYTDRQLRRAYDQLRFVHDVRTAAVERRIASRGQDDPAVAVLLAAVDGDLVVESEGERTLAPFLRRLDPAPEPQVWVTPRRRVDFYLRGLRFAWEYLGDADHRRASAGPTPSAMRSSPPRPSGSTTWSPRTSTIPWRSSPPRWRRSPTAPSSSVRGCRRCGLPRSPVPEPRPLAPLGTDRTEGGRAPWAACRFPADLRGTCRSGEPSVQVPSGCAGNVRGVGGGQSLGRRS
jgi:hypothetical protein